MEDVDQCEIKYQKCLLGYNKVDNGICSSRNVITGFTYTKTMIMFCIIKAGSVICIAVVRWVNTKMKRGQIIVIG